MGWLHRLAGQTCVYFKLHFTGVVVLVYLSVCAVEGWEVCTLHCVWSVGLPYPVVWVCGCGCGCGCGWGEREV